MSGAVVYIDCTNTVFRDKKTGIERVVMNILARIPELNAYFLRQLTPVVALDGQFYRIHVKNLRNRRASRLCYRLFSLLRNVLDALSCKRKNSDIQVDRLGSRPNDIHSLTVRIARSIIPHIFKMALRFDGVIASSVPLYFQAGDVLFLPDSIANAELYQAINNTNLTGLNVVLFLHDIIALRYNGVYEPRLHNNFKKSYDTLVSKASSIICASETVMKDVMQYNGDCTKGIFYDYAYLGSNFGSRGVCGGEKRDELNIIFSRSSYLMVGTIEPRKNHLYVLSAFQELWEKGCDVSLCIVGKLGWLCDDIEVEIRSNQNFNHRLFMLNDIDDNQLAYCYEHSKALIFASISEGFGLPLVEAMHFGKPVLASDIPVFREIGGDYSFYFSLDNPIILANLIEDFERGSLEKHFTPRSWISWDEAIFNLMSKVVGNVATGSCPQQL